MKIGGVNHIAIDTRNIQESVKFYREILGLKQGRTVGFPDFDVTYFELPDGATLELFDHKGKRMKVGRDEGVAGLRHIAFAVEDVARHERELREAGVTVTLPATDLPTLGVRALLFLDPNGVTVEFCEKLR